MPSLVCPSPNIIDHTFPRSNDELSLIQKALLKLTVIAEEEKGLILLTSVLSDFIVSLEESFCWEVMGRYPGVQIIYSVLIQLGLQQHGVYRLDVSGIQLDRAHPLPRGIAASEFSQSWSLELGRLLKLNSNHCVPGRFLMGVACTHAFADRPKGVYENPENAPSFPLIGPDEIESIEEFFKWDIPADIRNQNVSFNDAFRRVHLLGGTVHQPSGSSHYQVRFKGARTWPLDSNVDPLPDRFLRQLEPITQQSLDVVKYVLINGEWPKRIPKL